MGTKTTTRSSRRLLRRQPHQRSPWESTSESGHHRDARLVSGFCMCNIVLRYYFEEEVYPLSRHACTCLCKPPEKWYTYRKVWALHKQNMRWEWSLHPMYRCTKFCMRNVGVEIPGWGFIVFYTRTYTLDQFSFSINGKQTPFQLHYFG